MGLNARPVLAHGFGARYDLPIPLGYFLAAAAATVALSFVVIGLFVGRRSAAHGYPRYNLLRLRWIRALLASGVPLNVLRAASVGMFALVIAAALFGNHRPVDNLSPAFVWIIWWVGMGYAAALLGNLWLLVNPWKILFEWAERLMGGTTASRRDGVTPYPEGWDVWPALVLFLAFAWVENVYSGAAQPFRLGLLILLYSVITWGGMAVFGKHRWLRHGEAFSVLFGFFSRFSPTEVGVSDAGPCGRCGADCGVPGQGCVDCYECFEGRGLGAEGAPPASLRCGADAPRTGLGGRHGLRGGDAGDRDLRRVRRGPGHGGISRRVSSRRPPPSSDIAPWTS